MKRSNERKAFDDAIDTILKADPAKVKAEMEADRRRSEMASRIRCIRGALPVGLEGPAARKG
jgi:hypothetical protein